MAVQDLTVTKKITCHTRHTPGHGCYASGMFKAIMQCVMTIGVNHQSHNGRGAQMLNINHIQYLVKGAVVQRGAMWKRSSRCCSFCIVLW